MMKEMLGILLFPLVGADMIDYNGENRYYGETVREKLFKKPYRQRLKSLCGFALLVCICKFSRFKEITNSGKSMTPMLFPSDR